MSRSKLYLGIDIGGTTVKVALVDESERMIARVQVPTPDLSLEEKCAAFTHQLYRFANERGVRDKDIRGVGIAVPGVVQGAQIDMLPNAELDLQLLLENLRDAFAYAKIRCLNDANAAAYAEYLHGCGTDAASMLFVTIGTGIGSGFIVDGKLLTGAHGACGELGHIRVVKGGRRCSCGGRGCLEQYASAKGLVRTFREVDANSPTIYANLEIAEEGVDAGIYPRHESDSLAVFRAYERHDARARRAVDLFTKTLGFGLGQAATLLDPELIVLGGGVSESAALFFPSLVEYFRASSIEPARAARIAVAELGNEAGSLGAALYAMGAEGESY